MRQLSYWASTHTKLAILFIVLIEILKNWAGFRFGYRFLPALPLPVIELVVLGIVTGVLLIETKYSDQINVPFLSKADRYQLRTRSTFCLFMASFLLFIVLGNRFHYFLSPQPGDFTVQASVNRVERFSYESKDSSTIDDVQKTRPLTRKVLRKEQQLAKYKHAQRPKEKSTGAYILLFLLGVGLALLGSGLACQLACAGQGVAAVLVGLVSLGCLVGGIYFLVKAIIRKPSSSTVPRN
ncbi:hypothetical protein [Spirosoma validum]|uniref:Uncharacterized protein n=1 Tax=Spirosoma validum TaxID=2771355 RepID=A0A927AXR1_9BACT|nr:hypothetical protein [Spirosoma validum]MBD2751632.1 hypothetical protein [Spirosoma validum]